MALSNINILRQDGGLARPAASADGVSGLLFFGGGLDSNVNVGQYELTGPLDVESILGITADTVSGGATIKYHIDEYFRFSESSLFVTVANSATTDFSEIVSLKDFANGEIRQVGIYDQGVEFATSALTTIQAKALQCENEYAPLQCVYSSELVSGDTVEDLADLKGNDSHRVSVVIGEDLTSSSEAARLRTSGATLVGTIGTTLGAISQASVHENIGWVSKFNLVETEFQDPGFIDGTLVSDKSQTLLNNLDSDAYTFLRKFVGSNGTYFNFDYTSTSETSDFQVINNNRVYDKAFRLIRASLLPEVNAPLYVDPTSGKLSVGTIGYFKTLAEAGLNNMEDNREISGYDVDIDPDQNVLSTSKIEVVAKIVPVGVAKTIEVKLGFALSI